MLSFLSFITRPAVLWLAGGSPLLPFNVSRQGGDQGRGCLSQRRGVLATHVPLIPNRLFEGI